MNYYLVYKCYTIFDSSTPKFKFGVGKYDISCSDPFRLDAVKKEKINLKEKKTREEVEEKRRMKQSRRENKESEFIEIV